MTSSKFESLAQFIVRKNSELDDLELELQVQIEAIKTERDQLQRAALAAGVPKEPMNTVALSGRIEARAALSGRLTVGRSPRRASEKTIKEAVFELLKERNYGMTAIEILPEINSRLGIDYPRSSLSPQLSRLKNEGVLERAGKVWSLVRAPEEDKSTGPASDEDTPAALFPNSPAQDHKTGPGGGA